MFEHFFIATGAKSISMDGVGSSSCLKFRVLTTPITLCQQYRQNSFLIIYR